MNKAALFWRGLAFAVVAAYGCGITSQVVVIMGGAVMQDPAPKRAFSQ